MVTRVTWRVLDVKRQRVMNMSAENVLDTGNYSSGSLHLYLINKMIFEFRSNEYVGSSVIICIFRNFINLIQEWENITNFLLRDLNKTDIRK